MGSVAVTEEREMGSNPASEDLANKDEIIQYFVISGTSSSIRSLWDYSFLCLGSRQQLLMGIEQFMHDPKVLVALHEDMDLKAKIGHIMYPPPGQEEMWAKEMQKGPFGACVGWVNDFLARILGAKFEKARYEFRYPDGKVRLSSGEELKEPLFHRAASMDDVLARRLIINVSGGFGMWFDKDPQFGGRLREWDKSLAEGDVERMLELGGPNKFPRQLQGSAVYMSRSILQTPPNMHTRAHLLIVDWN